MLSFGTVFTLKKGEKNQLISSRKGKRKYLDRVRVRCRRVNDCSILNLIGQGPPLTFSETLPKDSESLESLSRTESFMGNC